jgi:hypothetical protein
MFFGIHCFNQSFFCTFYIYFWFVYFEGLILLLASSIDNRGPLHSLHVSTVKHNYINIDICIYFVFVIYDFVVEGIYMFVCFVCLIVFSATVNNISAIRAWWCFLLVEETGGPGENHRYVASH